MSYRSSSAKLSMRSSSSRITLVGYDGYDADLEPNIDVLYGTASNVKEWSRFDHLLAAVGINRRPKSKATASKRRRDTEDRETRLERSPWVLPVYVLSTESDEYRHLVPKEAKCTIDTGNLQGNIVSRAFLVDALGYSEADFHKLTKEEEDGGTGITGHKLIPDGAIHLTWYHGNSTRVFRDMRFLISEHPMYDLIIGARSIKENNILDVPNLVNGGSGPGIELNKGRPTNKLLDKLESEKIQANRELARLEENAGEEDDEEEDEGAVSFATKKKQAEMKFNEAKAIYEAELEEFCQEGVQHPKSKGKQWEAQDFFNLFKVKTWKDLPSKWEPKKGK